MVVPIMFFFFAAVGAVALWAMYKAKFHTGGGEDSYGKRKNLGGFIIFSAVKWATAFFVVLLLLTGACSCIKTVDAGHVGVLTLFGKVDSDPLYPGIHVVNPFKDMEQISTRTEVYVASAGGTGKEDAKQIHKDGTITVLSKDGLRVQLDVAVWFKVIRAGAPELYSTVGLGYVPKIVRSYTRAAVRDATVNYDATELYQEKRSALAADIADLVRDDFKERNIICEKVALRDIALPPLVAVAIQQKLEAQQEAQKMDFKLQKEEKEADRKRIEARGIKDSQDIIQKTLTKEYLQYYYVEALKSLVNSPNNTILVLPFDQKLTPLLNVSGGRPVPKPPSKTTK